MSEIGDRLLRAEVFAQGLMIEALASLHPDPEALRQAFAYYTNAVIADLLNSPEADEVDTQLLQACCDRLVRHIGTAGGQSTPPKHQRSFGVSCSAIQPGRLFVAIRYCPSQSIQQFSQTRFGGFFVVMPAPFV